MRFNDYLFHADYRREQLAKEAAQARLLRALKAEQAGDRDAADPLPYFSRLVLKALAR